jgi:hypothetical protein
MLQICKKFFGTSAVTHLAIKNVSLLQKTLTFTTIIVFISDRQIHTMMDSALNQWIIIGMLMKYMSSLISLVEYFLNVVKHHELSTTCGERTGFLFSKAGVWLFPVLFPPLTSFQTFVESSMAKGLSEHSFKAGPANGVA